MAHHYINTPQTEAGDRTRFTLVDADFSTEFPSFQAPAGGDDLLGAVRNNKNTTFATPRAPLAQLGRNARAKNEFTPLLKSATTNRLLQRDMEAKENHGVPATPAALKPGYRFSSPAIPEASSLMDTSMSSEHTPFAPEDSSSAMSTPMALPKRGELGMGADGGNVLTLREQEAKLALIDKENFGLKLKIHFLEENLKRSGSDWNQQAIRENTELKTNSVIMEHELKKYRKQFTVAERELEQYRQQLRDYAEKMKRRHMDEGMREELDRLQKLADEREQQLQEMQNQLDNAEQTQTTSQEAEKLMEEVEDLEAEVKEKEQLLDEREEEIESLKAKLQLAGGEVDAEVEEKEQRIEELEAEIQRLNSQNGEHDALQDELDTAKREHAAVLEDLRKNAEIAERDKREMLREFEARLQSYNREKNAELEATQRKIQSLEKDKVDEIESLELRLKLAESKGDNQSQLAQQAAQDARDQLKRITQDKDLEIENLRSQINAFEGVQDELETCQRQLRDYAEDVTRRHAEEARQEEAMDKLRDSVAEKDRELRTARNSVQEREKTIQEMEKMRGKVDEQTSQVSALQKTIDAQTVSLQELRQVRVTLADLERTHNSTVAEMQQLQSDVSDRDRQLETLRKTLDDRNDELEVLRQGNTEPDSQLEGLQSIVRHRDQDLEELRETANEQDARLEALQRTADERLRNIEELREELANTKQDLEDEVAVLEGNLDEAEDKKEELEAKIRTLENEMQGTYELQAKLEPVEKDLRAAQREKSSLERKIESLERDRDIADDERTSLQSTIDKLRKDLKTAQQAAETSSEIDELRQQLASKERALSSAERKLRSMDNGENQRLRVSENEASLQAELDAAEIRHRQAFQDKSQKHTVELKKLHDLLRSSTLEIESLNLRLAAAEKEVASIPYLQKSLKEKEREVRDLSADTTKQLHSKAQEAREEAGKLRVDIMDKEKRHAGELRGLAKQIQYLRSRCGREERFREGLAWQKKWFLMNIEMYNACNQADLKLIEEMGITPDHEIRDRRPTLRTVAQMFVFCHRVKKLSGQWGEKKKVQDSLVRQLESMRGRGGRRAGKA